MVRIRGNTGRQGDFASSESPPPVTVDKISIPAVVEVTDTGGMNAPQKRTEQGFDWSSYVDSQPLEVSVQAWVEDSDYSRFTALRDRTEPVPVSIGQVSLKTAVIENLEVTNRSSEKSHYEISFTIREVRQSSTDTTTLTVQTGNGNASSSSTTERPSFVQSESDSSGAGDEVESSGSDDGNFVSDAIGDAADAIGGLF